MNKTMCLIFILLTSCVLAPKSQLPIPASPPLAPVTSSFVYNRECPHICWLGINPGVTTTEEALAILSSSSQIDQDSYIERNEAGVRVEWHIEPMGVHSASVGIVFENGIVKTINFGFPTTVKIQEFYELFGEPDEISIRKVQTVEAKCCIDYIVYYTSAKASIFAFASTIDGNGPNQEDSVDILYLNLSPDDPNAPDRFLEHKNLRQPWLGFKHLEEYLKNRPSPLQ